MMLAAGNGDVMAPAPLLMSVWYCVGRYVSVHEKAVALAVIAALT